MSRLASAWVGFLGHTVCHVRGHNWAGWFGVIDGFGDVVDEWRACSRCGESESREPRS
jgi:hypothetical protein